jgi:hypothetical protein
MTGPRMRWEKVNKTYRKPTLDYRHEFDIPDRAARWLAAVERNQAQRRSLPSRVAGTQVSSAR